MKELLGGILLAIGILIAGASGLCSLAVLVGFGGGINMFPVVALIGGVPFLLGAALALTGRRILRQVRMGRSQPTIEQLERIYGDSPDETDLGRH
jgi:hypothetical protein